jgi:hypothetical protein
LTSVSGVSHRHAHWWTGKRSLVSQRQLVRDEVRDIGVLREGLSAHGRLPSKLDQVDRGCDEAIRAYQAYGDNDRVAQS